VAADIDEQRRVVDVGSRLLVQPKAVRQTQCDQALSQDVLHRLSETKIDAERQRRHQLGKTHRRHGRTIRL